MVVNIFFFDGFAANGAINHVGLVLVQQSSATYVVSRLKNARDATGFR